MKKLIGKKVRIILSFGNGTLPLEGILKKVNDWIVLETKGKQKVINKDSIVYIEKLK
jgi:RNase P/RNase MRP subunit p29